LSPRNTLTLFDALLRKLKPISEDYPVELQLISQNILINIKIFIKVIRLMVTHKKLKFTSLVKG